jgi:transposase InsO family protein
MLINESALAFEDMERGTLKESYFSDYVIPTVNHVPWEHRNMPIPPGIVDKVIEVLKLKIDAGVYEPSESSYRSRWFCVVKKNGKLRIVHDLQPLNKVTIRDAGMLPIVDDFVEGFAARQCYTVFDLFWGFDARRVAINSRELTAFMTPLGLLQITSLPTGFTNSPSEFQKCMVFILQDEIPDFANIFIDDLAIKGPQDAYLDKHGKPEVLAENAGIRRFIWEHALDVHRIMHRISCAGATFSGSKTQICRPEVLIIGQRCNALGRVPDTSKIDKILKWPPLTNAKDVRSFLGLAGTMRIWIANYSKLVKPLSRLYHQGVEFEWGPKQTEAFNEIKKQITSAPVLRPIDYKSNREVILQVDSSWEATGMILWQVDEKGVRHPARYSSIPMPASAVNYPQIKYEIYGLYRALRHWKFYLVGVTNLTVEMDASAVEGMLKNPDQQPNAIINRWIEGILYFDFKFKHVDAAHFRAPDALSRRPPAEDDETEESDEGAWLDHLTLFAKRAVRHERKERPEIAYHAEELPSCLQTRAQIDEELRDISHFLRTLEIPRMSIQRKKRFIQKAQKYFWQNDRLYRQDTEDAMPQRVILDPTSRLRALIQAHENLGHRGVEATYKTLKKRVFWPRMLDDVRHHVHSCHDCQLRSVDKYNKPITVSLPSRVWERVYLDIMRMPKDRHQKMYIIAAKDDLSGTTEARALTNPTASAVAKFFFEEIVCRYGIPESITTDNGGEFKGAFSDMCKEYGLPQIKISPYNSQANGVVERGHFVLREAIIRACEGDLKKWSEILPAALFADRITVKSTTGYSPYQLLHGTDPILPLDLFEHTFLSRAFQSDMTEEDLLTARIQQLRKLPEDVYEASELLKKARFKSKLHFEKRFHHRVRVTKYAKGQLVLMRHSAVESSLDRKQFPRYLGPYQVVRQNRGGAYILAELSGVRLADPVAAFRVTEYLKRDHEFMRAESRFQEVSSSSDSSDTESAADESIEVEATKTPDMSDEFLDEWNATD